MGTEIKPGLLDGEAISTYAGLQSLATEVDDFFQHFLPHVATEAQFLTQVETYVDQSYDLLLLVNARAK